MNPLRSLILAAAGNDTIRKVVATAPGGKQVVNRFVAGETCADAVAAVAGLADRGLCATLDYLGENTTGAEQAERTVREYLTLLDRLHAEGLAESAEVSVKLSALGQKVDEKLAEDNAWRICAAAEQCRTTVTVDMEDHTTTDSTLRVVADLRRTWPWVGAVMQSYLRRTESDLAELAVPHSRVRLVKGAYAEPPQVAFPAAHDVDLSFVRCVNALLSGGGYPMFATHDPRLIEVIADRARVHRKQPGSYEFQLLYG
ncbi:MAG: proline dehydrogenase family protein, partial [Pseudonocardiaceae bacterium]